MSIIWFILILASLIVVHEFGHFIVAKASNMRVDEFGIGLPPRAIRLWRKGETDYTLNWLPIGGFVKIHGENYDDTNDPGALDNERSFVNKPRHKQALVLVAGVTCNMIFAWLLISLGFMVGLPTPLDYEGPGNVTGSRLVVSTVVQESPAMEAGIKPGDEIIGISTDNERVNNITATAVSTFIQNNIDTELQLQVIRGDETHTITAEPTKIVNEDDREILGFSMSMLGTLRLPPHQAFVEGFLTTGDLTRRIVVGTADFLYRAITGVADYANVAGPVGIVGLVGDASNLGYVYLLQFTAFISINLAIINLIPIPALDGGRLLFVLIESIKGSSMNPKVINVANTIGFMLLIVLMIAITYNDILKLF